MPYYDVQCSQCSFEDVISLKLQDLSEWDRSAICPGCGEGSSTYRRIIKQAATTGGRALTAPKRTLSSGDKDDMRHKEVQRRDPNQRAEAIEIVKKGAYEGF